ncbi:hypothetical protein RB597_003341 [Gaeumannomyces tritici]
MAPHVDAPSPSDHYSNGFNATSATRMAVPAVMRPEDFTPPLGSPVGSSFDGSLLGNSAVTHLTRPLLPGVYVPTMCFFDPETEDVDEAMIAEHAVRLAQAGVTGLATQGSNGEAVHLTHDERRLVTSITRRALDEAGFSDMPLVVGCGSQSTRETTLLCREAWAAGGDYALVLPPSYYASLFAPASRSVVEYFTAVADASPIPLIIYNYPGAVNGMDLSSDVILELAEHPNIAGVKLTCGNTGKLNRVAAGARKLASDRPNPRRPEFLVLAGSADFTVQSLVAGGHGILAGLANIAPRACVRTIELYREGKMAEAQAMQEVISQGDWTAIQGGVVGVKSGMQSLTGYGGYGRSPLPRPTPEQAKKWREGFQELYSLEKSL